jgi:hypothetical protein
MMDHAQVSDRGAFAGAHRGLDGIAKLLGTA